MFFSHRVGRYSLGRMLLGITFMLWGLLCLLPYHFCCETEKIIKLFQVPLTSSEHILLALFTYELGKKVRDMTEVVLKVVSSNENYSNSRSNLKSPLRECSSNNYSLGRVCLVLTYILWANLCFLPYVYCKNQEIFKLAIDSSETILMALMAYELGKKGASVVEAKNSAI